MGPSVRRLYEQGKSVNGAGINASFAVHQVGNLSQYLNYLAPLQHLFARFEQEHDRRRHQRLLRRAPGADSPNYEPNCNTWSAAALRLLMVLLISRSASVTSLYCAESLSLPLHHPSTHPPPHPPNPPTNPPTSTSPLRVQDATGNASDIAVGWAIAVGAPFAFCTTLESEYKR